MRKLSLAVIGMYLSMLQAFSQVPVTDSSGYKPKKLKQSQLDTVYVNSFKLENGRLDWERFRKAGNKCFVGLSIPIFNLGKTKAVIKYNCTCGGLSGWGSTYFFEKKKSGWTIVGTRNDWIS